MHLNRGEAGGEETLLIAAVLTGNLLNVVMSSSLPLRGMALLFSYFIDITQLQSGLKPSSPRPTLASYKGQLANQGPVMRILGNRRDG